MNMTQEEREQLNVAIENLKEKVGQLRREHPEVKLGETGVKTGTADADPWRVPLNMGWAGWIEHEKAAVRAVIDGILGRQPPADRSQLPVLGPDNLWVWGGPTPYWGGSMAEDTLVRGAKYFNAQNVVYAYGPTNEKAMSMHAGFRRMLCQINGNCRTPGAQEGGTDEDNAERLGKLSLDYPNIMGAMCDDMTVGLRNVIRPERFRSRYDALKRHNDTLRMYGVVYVHELGAKDFSQIQPYLDVVTLWFWNMDEILDYDTYLEQCQMSFPGKPVLQGVFLHDYGRSDSGSFPELLTYQLDKAREYMRKGVVEGVVILGDREIRKWPETAAAVRDYLGV